MKLRPRIALVSCLVALASVSVTGALLIAQSRSFSQHELLERQTLLVQNRAFALGDSINVAARELTRLSHMAEVDLTDNDLRPEATLLAHAHRNSTLFNIGLQIEDARGRCLWAEPASPACPGTSYASEPWFVAGQRANGPVVMSEREGTEPSVIDLVVPIGGKPGDADGVLRGIIDLRTDRIVSPAMTASLPPGTEVALVTQDGAIIFPWRLERNRGWNTVLVSAAIDAAGAFVANDPGGPFLYAHAPVPHTAWGLVFRWPYRVLDIGLERQLRLLLQILAFGSAIAVFLGFASSRFLTRPLDALLKAVRSLMVARNKGQAAPMETPEGVNRADELGELTRAFVDLRRQIVNGDAVHHDDLERIRELANSLEGRVRARTAELEEAQRSLVAQERLAAMGRAAAVISHELKNSLNALGMGFDLVALEAERLPHLAHINIQVRAEVSRLRSMADELLVFARTPRLTARPTDLNALVRGTVELCSEQASTAGVLVTESLTEDGAPLVVSCDSELMRSVFVNLLQNAIEAVAWATTPRTRREVVISTQGPAAAGPSFASVTVEDSGPGVAPDVREHLFEPFFTTKRNGTGLGLATAQRFAAAHGGRIELLSSSLGGACFVVRLPIRNSRAHAEAA
ncbi:MAG TPA: ATP-binding protein [Anaeromyxobacteraceae bacterium]|nr:ATP-binding protein [Anaeromyxobacteraceae bacterium]